MFSMFCLEDSTNFDKVGPVVAVLDLGLNEMRPYPCLFWQLSGGYVEIPTPMCFAYENENFSLILELV